MKFSFSAVLLTDTGFHLNQHYHVPADTLDRLGLPLDAVLAIVLRL